MDATLSPATPVEGERRTFRRPLPPGASTRSGLEEVTGRPSNRLGDASFLIQVASTALAEGAELHYLGPRERLQDIRRVLEMGGRGLRMQDWKMPPLARVGRACHWAFPEIHQGEPLLMAAFGCTCLPLGLAERILQRPPGKAMLLLLDGVEATRVEVRFALDAISAFCRRTGVGVAFFP